VKVDADTGGGSRQRRYRAYKIETDTYVEVSKEKLENIALESTRTIDIQQFVPREEIDLRYLVRPYYIAPIMPVR
jgi:DNA end-binding protein Ku